MKANVKKVTNIAVLLLLFGATLTTLKANNIVITNATLTGQNTSSNFTMVQFDLFWDNSWRSSVGPGPVNWDAAYIFVKYQINNNGVGCSNPIGPWYHASLDTSASSHTVGITNGVAYTVKVARRSAAQGSLNKGVGLFMYRTNVSAPDTVDWDQVQVRWNYGLDGMCDSDEVTVKVFGIEMVYVPQESFYAGDGTTSTVRGQFTNGSTTSPLQITGEGALTLGGGGAGSLGNNNRTGEVGSASYRDDFDDATTETLPAAYPKGYDAFYCMKYECSQEQYMEFLNTLTATQQAQRTTANTLGEFHWQNGQTSPCSGNYCYGNGIMCRSPIVGSTPGMYACDYDDDGVYNETTDAGEPADGRYKACNYLSMVDAMAYMDWAGLRPMTELEWEKANRGNQAAIADEYSWGSANIHSGDYYSWDGSNYSYNNLGAIDELPYNPSTGINGNCVWRSTVDLYSGGNYYYRYNPIRCGAFATSSTNRVNAGATFYGIMEMTGNVREIFVSLGQDAGRSFTGEHGDGTLTATGFADEYYWPGSSGNNNNTISQPAPPNTGSTAGAGLGYKDSHAMQSTSTYMRVSDRYYSNYGISGPTGRYQYTGFRGVRMEP